MKTPAANRLKTRVMIVDDHPIVRAGVAAVLGMERDFLVCAECATAEVALEVVRSAQPDLAIVDLTLGTGSSIPLFRRLVQAQPQLRILALSMHDEAIFAPKALQAGAHGYVMKGVPVDVLIGAVRTVLRGQLHVSERMREQMLREALRGPDREPPERNGLTGLTRSELVVLQMIGAGAATRDIAEKLNRSLKTIEVHRNNIRLKLGLPNSTAVTHFAIRWVEEDARSNGEGSPE